MAWLLGIGMLIEVEQLVHGGRIVALDNVDLLVCAADVVGRSKMFGGRMLRVFHDRSEEHTSELQSRRDLVCRLLLEKKNKRQHLFSCLKHALLYATCLLS